MQEAMAPPADRGMARQLCALITSPVHKRFQLKKHDFIKELAEVNRSACKAQDF